jgi:large subunit ribosomal protein L30
VADKAQKTIRIKWIRSGIGFNRREREVVRSLGLGRLHQVVERPDTPQIRGLVAKVSHLVVVVKEGPRRSAFSLPEYTILPPEVAPVEAVEPQEAPVSAEGADSAEAEPAAKLAEVSEASVTERKGQKAAKPPAAEKEKKPPRTAAKKTKGSKPAMGEAKKAAKKEEKKVPHKTSKPTKGGKKK